MPEVLSGARVPDGELAHPESLVRSKEAPAGERSYRRSLRESEDGQRPAAFEGKGDIARAARRSIVASELQRRSREGPDARRRRRRRKKDPARETQSRAPGRSAASRRIPPSPTSPGRSSIEGRAGGRASSSGVLGKKGAGGGGRRGCRNGGSSS
ncbi:hypothetical protein KM043_008825 [Ampulex compressa]|nr:hypothetical protein KM043_008825 [Ampulex compressa]